MDPLVYFLFGAVFGAFGMAARIVDKYQEQAFKHGYDVGFDWARRLEQSRRNLAADIDKKLGHRLCRVIRFGAHGNLKRWQPIDEPFTPKKAKKK